MQAVIFTLSVFLFSVVLSSCASTSIGTGKTQNNHYSTISGWGSSIDPAQSQSGRGGYYNSVFYY